jgi:CubicO group peptidase (beta-lactamase class C family)
MTDNYRKFVVVLLAAVLCVSLTFSVKGSGKSRIKILDTEMKMNSKVNSLLKSLPAMVEEAFEESSLPSLSIAIVYDRDIIYSQAFGYADLEEKIPATTKTIYPIGSITKVFTVTMLVQLAEAGIVTLDTPVKKYLPEYKVKSPYKGTQPTTLRQLAMHTSGLPRDANINFWSDYAAGEWLLSKGSSEMKWYASTQELLASLPYIELEYPPNSRYSYSNLGVALLGIALERAAKKPFVEYIESHILKPLGMNDSGFLLHKKKPSGVPKGYVYISPKSKPLIAPEWDLGSAQFSGGLYSTAEDMARFLSLQFQDDAPGGAQIISADGLRMMHLESLGWGYVYGPKYKGIHHDGGHLGFYAYVRAFPALKIGIVTLTNSNNPLMNQRPSEDMARVILDELKKAVLDGSSPAAFNPEQVDLNKYVGKYTLPGAQAEISIELQDGQLHAKLLQDPTFNFPINPVGIDEFGLEDNHEPWFSFQRDDGGRIKNLKFIGFTFKRKWKS